MLDFIKTHWQAFLVYLDDLKLDGTFKGDVIIYIVTIVISGIFLLIGKLYGYTLTSVIRTLLNFRRRAYTIPKAFQAYKKQLDTDTLRLVHSWKQENVNLENILVPVNILKVGEEERLSLEDILEKKYKQTYVLGSRMVLVGEAGSGKSVALGVVSRKIWYIQKESNSTLLPILLPFSEIKKFDNDTDFQEFEKKLIGNLEARQFEHGKQSNEAELFVRNNLYDGKILILIDGFDELGKQARTNVGQFLTRFFKTYPAIPFIFTSRTNVWKEHKHLIHAEELNFETVEMASFTPLEVRQFLSGWKFEGHKSSEHLFSLTQEKPYLKALAKNPLMLTIIAYLYSIPKYILPDNRVKFYQLCVDALMGQFDNTKGLTGFNMLDSADKEAILSEIAYHHVTNIATSDEYEISTKEILQTIEKVMKARSRPVDKSKEVLEEISQRAELLVPLPPEGYKFPHRTFMEYFAACYFIEHESENNILERYLADERWEESLLLFCGLNKNQALSDKILDKLLRLFQESQALGKPNALVFRALVESRQVSPQIANQILTEAESFLFSNLSLKNLQPIIENLGYIAANRNWQHNEYAKEILKKLLDEKLPTQNLQAVLVALFPVRDNIVTELIAETLAKSHQSIVSFFENISTDSQEFALQLLERLPEKRAVNVMNGLRKAGKLEFLFQLMLKSENPRLQGGIAGRLINLTETDDINISEEFWDKLPIMEIPSALIPQMEQKYKTWQNKALKFFPKTEQGQKYLLLTCHLTVKFIFDYQMEGESLDSLKSGLSNWKEKGGLRGNLAYLIAAMLLEDYKVNIGFFEPFRINIHGLIYHWQKEEYKIGYIENVVLLFWIISPLFSCGIYNQLLGLIILCYIFVIILIVAYAQENKQFKNSTIYNTIGIFFVLTCISHSILFGQLLLFLTLFFVLAKTSISSKFSKYIIRYKNILNLIITFIYLFIFSYFDLGKGMQIFGYCSTILSAILVQFYGTVNSSSKYIKHEYILHFLDNEKEEAKSEK